MFFLGPIGPMELALIVLIVVIIFGARKLPELGKSMGESIKNFKKSISSKDDDENKSADEPHPPKKDE